MRIEKINLNAPSMKGSDKVQPKIEEQSNNNQNQELSNVYTYVLFMNILIQKLVKY